MRLKLLLFALLLTFASYSQISHAAQQPYVPERCGNPNGAYYHAELFPQFKDANNQLVLADWNTGEVVTMLAESLPYVYKFDWSPDCRYLVGKSVSYNDCKPGLVIWDTVSGEQKLALNGFCDSGGGSFGRDFWRPDSTAVLLSEWYSGWNSEGSNGNRFIWYPGTNQRVELKVSGIQPNLFQVYWDDGLGWVWGSSHEGVTAFDMRTGIQTISFINPPQARNVRARYTNSDFTFSPDHTQVAVYGQRDFQNAENEAMTVYDIASGVGTPVNVERNGAGVVALSPDNRYLVMGYTALRVWDLNALPEAVKDRLPIRRINSGGNRITALKFLDGTTVEITTVSGVSRWDVVTGAQVS